MRKGVILTAIVLLVLALALAQYGVLGAREGFAASDVPTISNGMRITFLVMGILATLLGLVIAGHSLTSGYQADFEGVGGGISVVIMGIVLMVFYFKL